MMRRLAIALAIVALPAVASAQTTTSTAPVVTPIAPAQRVNSSLGRPNRPGHNRPGNTNGYTVSPIVMMNGYAPAPAPQATKKPRAHKKSNALQQDQFGTWSTSGR